MVCSRRRRTPFLAALVLWTIGPVAANAAGPLVVAVDTSRSLGNDDLSRVASAVGDVMMQLPAGTATGLLRFADTPEWLERPGVAPAQVGAALGGLRPQGRFTLLHDAIFEAARSMPAGGAILVVTDGRDENSATTIEDIVRVCEERGIRLFTAAAGSRRDERVLRRLALLTGGDFLGPIGALDPGAAAARLATAARESAPPAQRASAPPAAADHAEPSAASAPQPPPAAPVPPARPVSSPVTWLLALALLAAIAVALFALRPRAKGTGNAVCSRCGRDLQPGESGECAACRETALVDSLQRQPVAAPGSAIEAFLDTGVFPQMSLEERLEKTFVMQEVAVLRVREPGEPVRSFALDGERAFSVGRSPQRASLAIPDPTLSAEHFRIVPRPDGFYLLDLGSTNGTLRSGERLRAARLRPGDLLHAGQEEFVFDIQQQSRQGKGPAAATRA